MFARELNSHPRIVMPKETTRRKFLYANSLTLLAAQIPGRALSADATSAGRWPIKELGLTKMDYTQMKCSEAEAILATGISVPLNEAMNEALVRETSAAIRKVAKRYTT